VLLGAAAALTSKLAREQVLHADFQIAAHIGMATRVTVEPEPEPVADTPPLELILFVVSASSATAAAIENVRRAVKRFPADTFALKIIDVSVDPERVLHDRIFVTPTLIAPASGRRVIGDLRDPKTLDFFLHALSY
jgi:hypothetical protein